MRLLGFPKARLKTVASVLNAHRWKPVWVGSRGLLKGIIMKSFLSNFVQLAPVRLRNWLYLLVPALCFIFAAQTAFAETLETFDEPGQQTFTVPDGVIELTVEVWGAGGDGADTSGSNDRAAGGGGGGYARSVVAVQPGEEFGFQVGEGGSSPSGNGASWFGGERIVEATGGASVPQSSDNGGISGEGIVGDVLFPGGAGGDRAGNVSGGGGSSAGSSAPGVDGGAPNGGAAPADGGDGGNSGDRGEGGQAGFSPGGGGGSSRTSPGGNSPDQFGGTGANGRVRITYLAPLNPLAEYRMEEPEWTGAAGEVADSTGNGFNGTMQNAGADTSITNPGPALPGDPGTCRYGAFDGNSYIEIADFPDLEDSFSITGWFRTRDRTEVGQRIFADDETNNNGYAVSLGDGGAGRIRFYHRALNPISLDTPPVIQNDTWYFVGAVLDESSQQKYIYIYDASGNLIDQTQGGYTGSLQTDGGTASIGGETNSGESQNRFRGSLDEIRVFDSALSASEVESVYNTVRPCAVPPLDNFEVVVPGTASVCEPADVIIRARDAANNTISDYSGTVNLTTSSGNGNWTFVSADGTLSPQPDIDDNGQAQYSFVNSDNGEITLGLSNRRANALTVTVGDAVGGQSGTSSVIQFRENAFVITQNDSLGDDFVAGRNHQLKVQAIRRDSTTEECGLVTGYNGNIDLKGWIQRTGADPGGASPGLAGGAGTDTMPNTEPANNNTILAFNQGVATPQWLTTDVGRYALNLKDDSSGIVVDENGDPRPVVGASQEWTVRPFGFHVSVARNPGASSAIGPFFLAAGRPFDLTVRAVVHEVGDDSDDNGIPDDHTVADPTANADLSNNTTTNAFGDGPPLTVGLAADLVAHPSSPANPGLSGAVSASSFTNGEATVSASYLEVGSISIIGDIGGSYLGRSATVIGRSGYVGRFHPELFTAQAMDGSFATECNGFVYSGQVHDYDLAPVVEITPRAHDAAGTGPLVSNYRENWQRLRKEDVSRIFPTEDADNGLDVTVGSVDATLTPLGDGRMDYVFGDDEYTYVKNQSSLMGPFASDLVIQIDRIDDGDAQLEPSQNPVELNPVGVPIRYGRLQLENAFGPETLPLLIPMRAEYWDGNRFVLNEEENGFMTSECWQYNPSGLEVDGSRLELNPGSVANNISADDTFGLDMGQPDPGMDPGGPDDGRIRLKSKSDELQPGDQNEEGVRFIVPIWLQGDFDGNGSLENPSALATFGVYRGNDRVIYWQER